MKPLKLSLMLILLSCAFLLSRASESAEPSKPTAEPTKITDKQTSDAQGAPSLTKPIPVTNPPPDEKRYPAKQEPPNWYSWLYDWLWLSVMPNWVTVAGSVAAIWLAITTLKVTNQSANAAKDAAEAAKDAANAAERQGIIMAALDRPWLFIDEPLLKLTDWEIGTPRELHLSWSVRNFGTGPAFLTKLSVNFGPEKFPFPEQPPYGSANPIGDKAIPQGRNHADKIRHKSTLTDEIVRDIEAGNACILFFGYFDYHDVLNAIHTSHFCCYWSYQDGRPYFRSVGPPRYMKYD